MTRHTDADRIVIRLLQIHERDLLVANPQSDAARRNRDLALYEVGILIHKIEMDANEKFIKKLMGEK